MNGHSPQKKIIWAINTTSENDDWDSQTIEILNFFSQGLKATIEPVTVLPFSASEQLQNDFTEFIDSHLSQTNIKGLQKLTLINLESSSSPSTHKKTQALIKYAKDSQADLIAAHLFKNKNKHQPFMGSFTEDLCLSSPLPILTIHPNYTLRNNFKKILFATDFSEESWQVFSEVLAFAKNIGAELEVHHWVVNPSVYNYGFYASQLPFAEEYTRNELQKAEKEIQRFSKLANDLEIKTTTSVKVGELKTYEGIVQQTKDLGADLIVMVSKSGPISSIAQGSTTRQVLRHAQCPVWSIHPS